MSITITVERPISRDGTYRTCFIAEATTQARDVAAYALSDVVSSGYDETTAAYEFCSVYFSQKNTADYILIKARYDGESLLEAYNNGSKDYSFICAESKNDSERASFSNSITTETKLFLYSGDSQITNNRNTVWIGSTAIENDAWQWYSGDDVLFVSSDFVQIEDA